MISSPRSPTSISTSSLILKPTIKHVISHHHHHRIKRAKHCLMHHHLLLLQECVGVHAKSIKVTVYIGCIVGETHWIEHGIYRPLVRSDLSFSVLSRDSAVVRNTTTVVRLFYRHRPGLCLHLQCLSVKLSRGEVPFSE
jgi:ribosomal protein S9